MAPKGGETNGALSSIASNARVAIATKPAANVKAAQTIRSGNRASRFGIRRCSTTRIFRRVFKSSPILSGSELIGPNADAPASLYSWYSCALARYGTHCREQCFEKGLERSVSYRGSIDDRAQHLYRQRSCSLATVLNRPLAIGWALGLCVNLERLLQRHVMPP